MRSANAVTLDPPAAHKEGRKEGRRGGLNAPGASRSKRGAHGKGSRLQVDIPSAPEIGEEGWIAADGLEECEREGGGAA